VRREFGTRYQPMGKHQFFGFFSVFSFSSSLVSGFFFLPPFVLFLLISEVMWPYFIGMSVTSCSTCVAVVS